MEAVENLSMLEKEKVCTLSYISCRRLAEKPTEVFAATWAESTPVSSCRTAKTRIMVPSFQTAAISPGSIP